MDIKLTLKKKWFDMILSGDKEEEYRDIKPYFEKRFNRFLSSENSNKMNIPAIENIHFYNGRYFSNKFRNIKVKFEGIKIDYGKEEWGAIKGVKYFVIKLGDIVFKSNC